jgi:RNA polymerase sigma factor (sigma-70 family)
MPDFPRAATANTIGGISGAVNAPSGPDFDALLANVGWVQSLARQLCTDAHLAEDAAQATWVAAVQQPPRDRGKVRGYLAQLLRNVLRMQGRSDGRRERRERAATPASATMPSAHELIERAELQQRLVAAVLALPAPQREVVLRHYFDGEDVDAIARHARKSADAVRALLRRARERLRADLERSGLRGAELAWSLPIAGVAAPAVVVGGIVMQGKLALVGAAVVAAAGAYWLVGIDGGASGTASSPSTAVPAVVVANAEPNARTPSPSLAAAAAPIAREAATPTSVRGRLIGLHARVPWRAPLAVRTTWHDGEREQTRDERASSGTDGAFVVALPAWSERCHDLRVHVRAEDESHVPLDWSQAVAIDPAAELQVAVEPLPVLLGTVVDARGAAVADATVMAFTVVDGVPKEGAAASCRAAADGSFRLRVPAAIQRLVAAVPPDGRTDMVASAIAAAASTVVELAPLVLPDAALVTGRVRHKDGTAITSAEVEWLPRSAVMLDEKVGLGWRVDGSVTRRNKAATDASGRFVLPALSGDKGRVHATRIDGWLPDKGAMVMAMVTAVAPKDVVVTVAGRPTTFGVLADGAPAGIANVELRRKIVAISLDTDEKGVLRMFTIDEPTRLRAVSKDGARSSAWHEFPNGPPEHVVLELLPTDGVPVVLTIDGAALPEARFIWRPRDGRATRAMRVSVAEGRYTMRVPPGEYRLSLEQMVGRTSQYLLPAEHDVVVPACGAEVRITAALGGRIRLCVTDAAGTYQPGHYRVLRAGAVLLPRAIARATTPPPPPDPGVPFFNGGPHFSEVVAAGSCEVVFDLGAAGERRETITIAAGETTDVFLRVP